MDYLTSKTNQAGARAADLINKTAAQVEDFAHDFAKNPEMTRALLKLLFVPQFRPTFVEDPVDEVGDLEDVDIELLGAAAASAKPIRYPYRMFDLKTKCLVSDPDIGALGQYCILSHSWKGSEIKYGDVINARKAGQNPDDDDVTLLKKKFKSDLEKQAWMIKSAADSVSGGIGLGAPLDRNSNGADRDRDGNEHPDDEGIRVRDELVATLLRKRKAVNWVIDELNRSRKEEADDSARKKSQALDAKIIDDLERDMENQVTENMPQLASDVPDTQVKGSGNPQRSNTSAATDTGSSAASIKVQRAEDAQKAVQRDIDFFERHVQVRDAVDGMVTCLQKWKSVNKIEQSISRANEIFDSNMFPLQRNVRRYLWNDTCCIDKSDSGEVVESLSIMGDWYAHAEFCLVHLDTRSRPQYCTIHQDRRCTVDSCPFFEERQRAADEWVVEWDLFKNDEEREANIENFSDVRGYIPEWAERGWTLQELVLSKMTFYVNSAWKFLSRPIETLGIYYYLCPFIELYCYGNEEPAPNAELLSMMALAEIMPDSESESNRDRAVSAILDSEDGLPVKRAQKLIKILEALGVHIHGAIEKETAKPWITQAVYLAAKDLSNGTGGNGNLLQHVNRSLGRFAGARTCASCARDTINVLLKCLVAEAMQLIRRDREYIASFSNIHGQLIGWEQGTSRTRFSADKVMNLACKRNCTVETDSAYSLMGLVQVRFPTHSAEGLPKAMARLLDEIIVSSNDVSVFNWKGINQGSPVRGRSLYPSSPKAYKLLEFEDAEENKQKHLAQAVQGNMHRVIVAYKNIFRMLREAIEFMKSREQRNLPVEWVHGIIDFVQKSQFRDLDEELRNVGKILLFIQKRCGSQLAEAAPTQTTAISSSEPSQTEARGSPPPVSSIPSSLASSASYFTTVNPLSKFSGKKSDVQAGSQTSSYTLPTVPSLSMASISTMKPSFPVRFGRKDTASSKGSIEKMDSPTPTSPVPSSPTPRAEVQQSAIPKESSPKAIWQPLHQHVMSYIHSITPRDDNDSDDEDGATDPSLSTPSPTPQARTAAHPVPRMDRNRKIASLPREIEEFSAAIDGVKLPGATATKNADSMISPNPIIVNSSGIEGSFDIQRVIITFRDAARLRAHVRSAVTPDQKITGWCTISTGFAMVVVKFACEKQLLEQQLDIVQTVDRAVLRQQSARSGTGKLGVPGAGHATGWLAKVGSGINASLAPGSGGSREAGPPGSTKSGPAAEIDKSPVPTAPAEEDDDGDSPAYTLEEQKVSRMIAFIQEPSLDAVAGEWVLLRISGVPGACWFLATLELGTSHALYSRRIPTDDIDFANASPEPGLLGAWQTYMARKKRRLCKVLRMYIESNEKAGGQDEAVRQARRVLEEARDGRPPREEEGSGGRDIDGGTDAGPEQTQAESQAGFMDHLLGGGKMAARLAGRYTVLAVLEKVLKMQADHLDRTLGAAVLKRTPKALQPAVENLNQNQNLLPAMFHSSKRVHML